MVNSRKYKDKHRSDKSIWILLLGTATTSLVIDRKAYDPFNTIKLISILIISSWLIGHLINSYRKNFPRRRSGDLSVLLICALFLLSLVVSAYFSQMQILALVGDSFRRNGLLQYCALVVMFLFASRSIDFKEATKIYKISILTALIMSGYGLIQISGNDFFAWNNPYNSMISTVGNPNFASALLAVFFLLSGSVLLLNQLTIKFKFFALLSMVMALIAIILSDSRQGLVTIAIGILFYSSIYFYFKKPKIGITLITISISITFAGVLGMLQKGPLMNLLYKDSVSVRGFYWQAGIEMFLDKPLTGVGLDNYGAYFKQFRELEYPLRYGFDITSSNAHNTIIQLFATGGLFVGLIYLVLLGYILLTGIVLIKNIVGEDQKIAIGLLSAWLAFQAQTIISIDNIGVSVWGWLLGGSIIGLARKSPDSPGLARSEKVTHNPNSIPILQPLLSALFLIPAALLSFYLLQAERDLLIARDFADPAATQNKPTVEFFAKEVIKNPLAITYYKLQAASFIYDMGDTKLGYEMIKKINQEDPGNLDTLRIRLAIESSNDRKENSIMIRNEIAQKDPWNVENLYQLSLLYKGLGKIDQAIKYRDKIMQIAPNSDAAKKATELIDNS